MAREEAIKRIDEQYKICKEFYYLSANPEKDCPRCNVIHGGACCCNLRPPPRQPGAGGEGVEGME